MNYRVQRAFEQTWLVDGVVKYHRRLETYVNTLIQHNFVIETLTEPMPTQQQINTNPSFAIHAIRPPLLLIKARMRTQNNADN